MNLWNETISCLEDYGFEWSDVIAIVGDEFQITKDNFKELAVYTEYDAGFGSMAVATDLELIGHDFRFVRREYDGKEWWERTYQVNTPIVSPYRTVQVLGNDVFMWNTLSEMNSKSFYSGRKIKKGKKMTDIVKFDVKMTEDEAVALYGLLKGVAQGLSMEIVEKGMKASGVSDLSSALLASKKGVNRLLNEMELYLEVKE